MNIGFSSNQSYGFSRDNTLQKYAKNQNGMQTEKKTQDIKQMLREAKRQEKKQAGPTSLVDQQKQYAKSLNESRVKSKDTSNEIKKLKYNFKGVSAQILRAKTSSSARQAASKARREVVRLKRMGQSGEYDAEELQAAISHAQAMERVAKKKAMHLQQEEMVKVSDEAAPENSAESVQRDILEENFEQMQEQQDLQQEMTEEQMEAMQEVMAEQMEAMQDMMEEQMEAMQDMLAEEMANMQESMMSSMEEMLEETSALDLMDAMSMTVDMEMTPDEFKMLKIKHRNKESKDIVEADVKYLKAIFDKLEATNSSSVVGGAVTTGVGASVVAPAPVTDVNLSQVSEHIDLSL